MNISVKEEYVEVKVQLAVYNTEVLHKCFYWYSNEYVVDIEIENSDTAVVKIYPKNIEPKKIDFETLTARIRNDLIDFKTRDIVTKETKNVRDLLIAKAFAHCDEFDSKPVGEISDSLGFDPSL